LHNPPAGLFFNFCRAAGPGKTLLQEKSVALRPTLVKICKKKSKLTHQSAIQCEENC
jgi:hypothetical protein